VDGGSGSSGGDGGVRAAMRSRERAAAALEAYVRARLYGSSGGTGGGGGGGTVLPAAADEEMEELQAVITSFRQRQSLGQAEEKARGVLPATVDLARFAGDLRYRQAELERAATDAVASWAASSSSSVAAGGGKGPRDVITLASEYPNTDVWRVAAAATTALLGRGYAKLRSRGVAAPAAVSRVETELRNGGAGGGGGALLEALLDGGGGRGDQDALQVVREVFVGAADGDDLHHLDLLLRLMSEAAAQRSGPSAVGGAEAGGSIGGGTKNPIDRRLNAHVGLMRRLLKAAPPGLDYKALIGVDPLADPLADPTA
ncbi:unnamed protein product, partial [Ectocarpus fasciculatus]